MTKQFEKFNINDQVWVKLTDYGRKCILENREKLNQTYGGRFNISGTFPEEDSEGWSRWILWALMSEFGPYMMMGGKLCFETDIRFEIEPEF